MTNDEEPGWSKIRIRQPRDEVIKYGPTLEVGAAKMGGRRITALAQVDTGAAGTCISKRLADCLGLQIIDAGELHQAGSESTLAPYFRIRLFIENAEIDLDVAGFLSFDPPHDILIGRDILENCRLSVDFTTGFTCLHIKSAS